MSTTTIGTAAAPMTLGRRPTKIHPVDEVLPIAKLAAYGFQHVLAFYAGAVLVPIIVAGALELSPDAADPPDQRRPVHLRHRVAASNPSASGRSACGCRCCRA